MKRVLIYITLTILVLPALADTPPRSYHELKARFLAMDAADQALDINPGIQKSVGIGMGVGLVAVSGYFLMTDDMQNFQTTAIIGGAAYVSWFIVTELIGNKRGRPGPYGY